MRVVALVMGILALIGMLVALLPCVGALNWLNIPFSFIGLIISIIALIIDKHPSKWMSILGIVFCGIAILGGGLRLLLGGGVL